MQTIVVLVLIFLSISGPCAYGEQPWTSTNFSFGLPFYATQSDPCPKYPEGLCLADSVEYCRTDVALISGTGVCSAKTLYRFRYKHPGGVEFEATVLEGTEQCLTGADVAVLGVNAQAVRVIPAGKDQSPVPSRLESKARNLLDPPKSESQDHSGEEIVHLSHASPKVLKMKEGTLLMFEWSWPDMGPIVWVANNNIFPLAGRCAWYPIFFYVHDKLHIAYKAQNYCQSGQLILYVYDLSGEVPKKVCENEKLSD